LKVAATVQAGLFSGGALFVSLVEHPARLECDTSVALAQWRPSYRRAARLQGALALGSSVSTAILAAMAWRSRASHGSTSIVGWLACGAVILAIVPYTLLVILPVNTKLLQQQESATNSDELLHQWGFLHAVRTTLSLGSFIGCAVLLAKGY